MLYIYVIQKRASPPEIYRDYLSAATRCQDHISGIAEKGSLSERYCLLLEELHLEVLRQTERVHPSIAVAGQPSSHPNLGRQINLSVPHNVDPTRDAGYTEMLDEGPIEFDSMMTGSVSSDYPGWGQFASMVSSGLGNLDMFLEDDLFKL